LTGRRAAGERDNCKRLKSLAFFHGHAICLWRGAGPVDDGADALSQPLLEILMQHSLLARLGGATLALGMSFGAAAVPLSTVGSLDQLLDSAYLGNQSLASENAFVQDYLGDSYTLTGKYDGISSGDWEAVDGDPGGYALRFSDLSCTTGTCDATPSYFVIKLGVGGSPDGTPDTYLFQNMAAFEWAYVQLQQFAGVTDMNIGRVSHIAVGNGGGGGGGDVPEPASLALLGLGLLGLGAARRLRPASKV
jgi:hypothetical protein